MTFAGGPGEPPRRDWLHGGRRARVVAIVVLLAIAYVTLDGAQGDAGGRRACEVRGPATLDVCELVERGPLVLASSPRAAATAPTRSAG